MSQTIEIFIGKLYKADAKQRGCTVKFWTITNPANGGECYGCVTYGMDETKRLFHSEEELLDLLDLLGRKQV